MRLDGAFLDIEFAADGLVGLARRQQVQHLHLMFGLMQANRTALLGLLAKITLGQNASAHWARASIDLRREK